VKEIERKAPPAMNSLMKKQLMIFACLLITVLATSAFAEGEKQEEKQEKKAGANLDLFPPPKADASKSARPAKPELTAPAYRAQINGDSVTLKWSQVPAANAYHLQVATDPNFKWLTVNQEMMTENTFEVKGLEKGKHYFWRVAALKTDNLSTFMKGWFSLSTFETP
jgi:hypothetical protein